MQVVTPIHLKVQQVLWDQQAILGEVVVLVLKALWVQSEPPEIPLRLQRALKDR